VIGLPDWRQQQQWDCGPTAVRILLRSLRRRPVPTAMAHLAASPIDGTDPRAVEIALRAHDLRVMSGSATWDDLRHMTQNRAVICLIQCDGVGHWVVAGRVTHRRISYQCPSAGPVCESRADWMARWRDVDRLGATYHQWAICGWR